MLLLRWTVAAESTELSWKEALTVAWENFTGVRGGGNWSVLACILLLLGSLWAAGCSLRLGLPPREEISRSGRVPGQESEERQLRWDIQRARFVSIQRSGAASFPQALGNEEKRIFGAPDAAQKNDPSPALNPPLPAQAPVPLPGFSVRAIMLLGKDGAAVVDIPGEEAGRVVRPGDSFLCMGKKGRVTRIAEKGLTLQWDGRKWDVFLE